MPCLYRNKLEFVILFLLSISRLSAIDNGPFIPKYNINTKITISQGDTSFVFSYVKPKNNDKQKSGSFYYYYNNGNIGRTKGGYTGKLLDDLYIKQTREGLLVEKGYFKNGLKHKEWVQWHTNGEIQSKEKWHHGSGFGRKQVFDETGMLVFKYKWRNSNWELTSKYANMEVRNAKIKEKEEKKEIKKNEKSLEKLEKKQQKSTTQSQKTIFKIFEKKTENEINSNIGEVMPESNLEKQKNIKKFFNRKEDKIEKKEKEEKKEIKKNERSLEKIEKKQQKETTQTQRTIFKIFEKKEENEIDSNIGEVMPESN